MVIWKPRGRETFGIRERDSRVQIYVSPWLSPLLETIFTPLRALDTLRSFASSLADVLSKSAESTAEFKDHLPLVSLAL
jgi:hypothetical protein